MTAMAEDGPADALLSDLCSICNVNPLKYSCPRCGAHTCSLPCVKRHKLWAQCSGIRDPAAYRKRSELATASSVDRDFNFITNIERSLQKADDDGIGLAPVKNTKPKLEAEIERSGVAVIRAPKGLSRSKQNRTHWDRGMNCLVWTVEWIFDDGKKSFTASAASHSISKAFLQLSRGARKKRKASELEPSQSAAKVTAEAKDTDTKLPNEDEALADQRTELPSEHSFYLHRPNTPSKVVCLIPLPPDTSLSAALKSHTVLEFPTIYVLKIPPESLEPPYITESDYVMSRGSEVPIELSRFEQPEEMSAGLNTLDKIDDEKMLEVFAERS